MRKPKSDVCSIHNIPLMETNPADVENGPHPSDVENRLVCVSCESMKERGLSRKDIFVSVIEDVFAGREDGSPRGGPKVTTAVFMREHVRPMLKSAHPRLRWAIVECVIGRGGLSPAEVKALRFEGEIHLHRR